MSLKIILFYFLVSDDTSDEHCSSNSSDSEETYKKICTAANRQDAKKKQTITEARVAGAVDAGVKKPESVQQATTSKPKNAAEDK